jgi:hypothetical protein
MIKDISKVINKFVELSKNGYLTISYTNKLVSIDFHATEEFALEIRDNDTYRLYYFDELHACPFEIKLNKSDIKEATYYAESEFEKLPFGEVVILTFCDGSELHCFEDVK